MKIGIVLSNTPGYSETFFRSKIKGLREKGMEVILYVQNKEKGFDLCPVEESPKTTVQPILLIFYAIAIYASLLPYFRKVLQYIKLERKDGARVLEIMKKIYSNAHLLKARVDWMHYGFGTMALGRENVAAAIGAKMAVSFRGFDMYIYPVKHEGCYKKLFSKRVKYHVLSEEMKKDLIHQGIDATSIIKITPAIDISLFSNFDTLKKTAILKILTIARLHWKKGLEQTLEALALLKEKNIPFQYTIIGEGMELERLRFAAYQLGLTQEVVFKGKLTPAEVKAELQEAGLYIQYSHQEGFSNSVLEAQAMGKLCLVSDADGLAENVLHGITGFVIPKRNPRALAKMIAEVAVMPEEERNAMADTAVKRVAEEFNVEMQIAAFETFYRDF